MASLAANPLSQFRSPSFLVRSPPNTTNLNSLSLICISITRLQTLKSTPTPTHLIRTAAAASTSRPSPELELTPENVNAVLDDVRPYLIADGGDVQVVSVVDGIVSLKLQGACESCPSSTTTMKMGIERRLKEKFGHVIKEVCQVYETQPSETSVQAVNNHLEILRPAIKNFGGSVEVLSVEGGECMVKYNGPASIGSGVRDAIKEKFPDILNVVLTE